MFVYKSIMPLISFSELTKQVHLLNDIILEDMIFSKDQREEELVEFSRHLYTTKNWFTRISAPNKKLYLMALLEDVTSAWAVAVILLCIWNCQTKDAAMSRCEAIPWSCYDQLPMDHNRTAMPLPTLAQVMKTDRKWFLSLEPDSQSVVVCELLSVTGGPVMAEVLRRAQVIYERYRKHQLKKMKMNMLAIDAKSTLGPVAQGLEAQHRQQSSTKQSSVNLKTEQSSSAARKNLNDHLLHWENTIKSMKDALNLKEEEITFDDGTKQNIWKVKRTKPEDIETVDFIQLLPSAIGKRILSYLPEAFLPDCARVNKYWSYLVEDQRAERTTRTKLQADAEKLQELMLQHEHSLESFQTTDLKNKETSVLASVCTSAKLKAQRPLTMMSSVQSAGAYSFRHFISDRINKPDVPTVQIPIRNMADLTGRVDRRGAIDENIWGWCAGALKRRTNAKKNINGKEEGGVLLLGKVHFPCPLMAQTLKLPLYPPLVKDHTARSTAKSTRNISNMTVTTMPRAKDDSRFCLWTRNVSRLYLASKVPSYTKLQQ